MYTKTLSLCNFFPSGTSEVGCNIIFNYKTYKFKHHCFSRFIVSSDCAEFRFQSSMPSRAFQFGQKVSILFDSRYRIDFFDSIRFANLINLPLLHWYSNSNDGEFGEGPGGVFLRCGPFCAISVSIRQFPCNKLKTSKVLNAANNDVSLFFWLRLYNK